MSNDEFLFLDNRPAFINRVKKEYKLPDNDPVIDAILEGTAISMDRGFAEMDPVREKYQDLLCPWCNRLHQSQICMDAMVKAEAEAKASAEAEQK